jgi:hypothetical protein
METLRDLLEQKDYTVLEERVGIHGRELLVRSPEGRLVVVGALTGSAHRDIQILESVLYGEPEPGPILRWASRRPC